MRRKLRNEINSSPPFPEVVGDRRLLRFYSGNERNINKACRKYAEFLKWREIQNVDRIRQEIVYGGKNCALKFPSGEKILRLFPQIIMSGRPHDKDGRPLILEHYDFTPEEVLKEIAIEEYKIFFIYCMEFRMLILEQLSERYEREYVAANAGNLRNGYGVILKHCIIRDLKGITFSHINAKARAIFRTMMDIDTPYYPDIMEKAFHINAPKIFNDVWYFVKGFLPAYSVAKINIYSTSYLEPMRKQIPIENIPTCIGGMFEISNEPFEFDLSDEGGLHYDGATEIRSQSQKSIKKYEYRWSNIIPGASVWL
jgi:hypothetical protein